ncbi:TnsA endonuclease N-terminal domain-containing protein [Allosphingosinicella sp.]|uniref:TnsA endonuclease N-terminal domain-containing protein n=1 Tax=Allosphingosinicella sp. TaxID=2823234 RepID=UPI002FC0E39E
MTLAPIDPDTLRWIKGRRKQGRGSGTGADYKPWLTVRDVSSHGDVHRPLDRHGRTMHLLSTREFWGHLILERSDAVVDVQEQFPLFELDETREIAAELGYRHPKQRRKIKGRSIWREEPMTTDFLVTLKDVDQLPAKIAISIKTIDEIEKSSIKHRQRLLEKVEIERTYWARRGIPFMMITDRELPENLVHNLDLILPCRSLEHYERFADVEGVLSFLLDRIRAAPTEPLGTVCSSTDYELDLEPGSCLVLVWHALATRMWNTDLLGQRLDPALPIGEISRGHAVQQGRLAA